jgi:hypothetical protein
MRTRLGVLVAGLMAGSALVGCGAEDAASPPDDASELLHEAADVFDRAPDGFPSGPESFADTSEVERHLHDAADGAEGGGLETPDSAGRAGGSEQAAPDGRGRAAAAVPAGPADGDSEWVPPVFERPERIRGIYLNAWASGSRTRTEALIEMARRTEINTFVIDVKDDTGFMSYRTGVELAKEIGADRELRILNVQRLLRRLEEEGIYPIARIVVFKDHLLAEQRPDMAIQDSAGGAWIDGRGDVWVNPYDERVWAYHVDIAREAAELGFPEIQWDYVRFPDRPQSELARAVFPGRGERTRSRAIRDFLIWSGEELADLGVPLTADVFGMATSARTDVGIGQLWEDFIDVVDAALPMVYPSHYWAGSFGIEEPNAHPYEVIQAALRHALRRNEAVENPGRIIPWLQDFTLGPPRYEAPEVRAQILATYDVGIEEWILWNSAGRYTEEALEPVGGWPGGEEPPIRFAGAIAPAAARFLPVEEQADQAEAAGAAAADTAAADTARVGGGGPRR